MYTHKQILFAKMLLRPPLFSFFFFNDTATTEIYTLSLHDALPISCDRAQPDPRGPHCRARVAAARGQRRRWLEENLRADRKSTRLNSSHSQISYAVFCLKKKKKPNSSSRDHIL